MTEYESFCKKHGNFMQSERWAKVKIGWDSHRIVVEDKDGEVKGVMQLLIKRIPRINACVMYAPRGPVCDFRDREITERLLEEACEYAVEQGAIVIGFDPLIEMSDTEVIDHLTSLGARYHPERLGYETVQCRENYQLDIEGKSAEEVFAGFRPKHRYNIRLAQRKGVQCSVFGKEKLDDFVSLMKETSERDGFQMRSGEYFARMLDAFGEDAGLCMCYCDGIPLSGALFIEYGGVMSYVYGCSSDEHRGMMPNYLMQWTMIQRAIARGFRLYDFCGIPYWYDPSHHNYGVYRFKKGFGGDIKTYAGEFELVLRPRMYRALRAGAWVKKHIF